MKQRYSKIAFWLVMLIIIASPIFMIARYEMVLNQGTVYHFQLKPVDPYDALRGRYMYLSYKEDTVVYKGTENFVYNDPAFITIENKNGFAVLKNIYAQPPTDENYIKAKVIYDEKVFLNGDSMHNIRIDYPCDHYFMNENIAGKADNAYRESTRNEKENCYAEVVVYRGNAIVKALFINAIPIEKYVRDMLEKEKK